MKAKKKTAKTRLPAGVVSPDKTQRQALALGQLVGNLQSLELIIRRFLYSWNDPPHEPFAKKQSMSKLKMGDTVEVNSFTSFESLGELLKRFNAYVGQHFPGKEIDLALVQTRDALAHGRIFSDRPGPPFHLYKFAKPQKGSTTTTVTFAVKATPTWLRAQAKIVGKECRKVARLRHGPDV